MDVDALRAEFPILSSRVCGKRLVYLDNAATTQVPRRVLDRIVGFYGRENGSTHRSAHSLAQAAGDAYEGARATVRAFINAGSPSEIVFTSGTTESINLVAGSFGEAFVRERDEIVVSAMEHHANLIPWQRLCERTGAILRVVPVDEGGALRVDGLKRLINDHTRLIAVAHVSNVTGIVNPVSEIVAIAHSHDVPVLIDGAQGVPHVAIDVVELGCDFYAFSGHKMYSGHGIGVLFGKRRWLDAMPPYQLGGGMITTVTLEESRFEDPPLRFEAGTRNVAAALGLEAAIELTEEVGRSSIASHEESLLRRLEEGLRVLGGVTVHGAKASRCGSLSFNLDGVHHADVGMVLDKLGIAVRTGTHCAEPYARAIAGGGTVRASVALYNTEDDVDYLLEAVARAGALLR